MTKRYELGNGDKGPMVYDNKGVDDYYFILVPGELEEFIELLNSEEDHWEDTYDCLLSKYNKQLNLNNKRNLEISKLKEENEELKNVLFNIVERIDGDITGEIYSTCVALNKKAYYAIKKILNEKRW